MSRLRNFVHTVCTALYDAILPEQKTRSGEFLFFSQWFVSPLSHNTYVELIDREIALHSPLIKRELLTSSCTETVLQPLSPASQTDCLSASTSSLMPPPPQMPRASLKKVSTETPQPSLNVIPSANRKRELLSSSDVEGVRQLAQDLNISEEKMTSIMQTEESKKRRYDINIITTGEFAETLAKNKSDAEKTTIQTTTITVKHDPNSARDDGVGEPHSLSMQNDNGEDPQIQHQITSNEGASLPANPQVIVPFLQTTLNNHFETTSVVGAIAQLCLVVALEPINFTMCLSFARRRNQDLIADNLLDIYNAVNNNTDSRIIDETQILSTVNDKLTINFFSRFPELSIECKSLGVPVLQSIFSLAALASQLFDINQSTQSLQSDTLAGFKFNDVFEQVLGDRSRLIEAMCRSAIAGIGGNQKRQLVTSIFVNALYKTSEHIHTLYISGCHAQLPLDNVVLRRLLERERMLTRVARNIVGQPFSQ